MSNTVPTWREAEIIQLVDFVAREAQNREGGFNAWKVCEKYQKETRSKRKLEEIIEKCRQSICNRPMYLDDYDFDTRVKVYFSMKIPVNNSLMKLMRENGEVELDKVNVIEMYRGCNRGIKLGFADIKAREPESEEKMLEFLANFSRYTSQPVTNLCLAQEYKRITGCRHLIPTLVERFRLVIKPAIQTSKQYDLLTRIRMLSVSKTPLGDGFLAKIRRNAFVQVDYKNRIEVYIANDDSLQLYCLSKYREKVAIPVVNRETSGRGDGKRVEERTLVRKEARFSPIKAINRRGESSDSPLFPKPVNKQKRIHMSSDESDSDVICDSSRNKRAVTLEAEPNYVPPKKMEKAAEVPQPVIPDKEIKQEENVVRDFATYLNRLLAKNNQNALLNPDQLVVLNREIKQEETDTSDRSCPSVTNGTMTPSAVGSPRKDYYGDNQHSFVNHGSTSTRDFLKLLRGLVLTMDSPMLESIGLLIQRTIDECGDEKVLISDVVLALKTIFRMVIKKSSNNEPEETSLSATKLLTLLQSIVFSLDAPVTLELRDSVRAASEVGAAYKVSVKTVQLALESSIELVTSQHSRL
ncbi:hypothetical protein CRE_09291 [Caenorhabditis remanei]|uniref:Uncharacterized protein n=1 Tax=Caenorhabditis remanei TaxID=31234 RepID=E3LI12_CAERE|nr:hypothetical protein CRE_09291 [Caenorhabditis remanei]